MNEPYVIKKYGLLEANYIHSSPNRRERRKKELPFKGNAGHISLTVSNNMKYVRHVQVTPDGKRINHYLAR